jgi:hypothetical protein
MPPEGKHTGERLADQNPRKYRTIIRLLSEGKSVNSICKSTKTNHGTIEAIQRKEAQTIAERKRYFASIFARIAQSAAEQIEDNLARGKYPATALIPVYGCSIDKLLRLSDQATNNVNLNVNFQGNIFHAFQRYHEETMKLIEARKAAKAQQPPPLSLPDSPQTCQDPT